MKLKVTKALVFSLLFAVNCISVMGVRSVNFAQEGIGIVSQDVAELVVNIPITRRMSKNQEHQYTFTGEAGRCLNLAVEQLGTDVDVELFSSSNRLLAFVQRSNTILGQENLAFVLPDSGEYVVKIRSGNWVEIKNGYKVELKPFTDPNERDLRKILAQKLVSEAGALSFSEEHIERQESVEKFLESIEIWKELGDKYEELIAYYGLGWTYINLGQFEDADASFGKVVVNARAMDERFMLGHGLRGRAIANSRLGEHAGAVISIEESIKIFNSLEMYRYIAMGQQSLGYAQFALEDFSSALASFTNTLSARKKAEDVNGEILTLTALAKTHSRIGNYQVAFEFIEKANAMTGTEMNATKAQILTEGGWILVSLNRFDEAEQFLNEVLKYTVARKSMSGQAMVLCGLGLARQGKGDLKGAIPFVEKSLSLIESIRLGIGDSAFRMSFSSTNLLYYEIYIHLLMELHRKFPDEGFDVKALEISERARARVLLDLVSQSNFSLEGDVENEAQQLVQIKYIATLRTWKSARATKNGNAVSRLNEELQSIILEKRNIDREITRRTTSQSQEFSFKTVSSKNIQELLDDDTILLEFGSYRNLHGSDDTYLWAVTNEAVRGFVLPRSQEIIPKVEDAYRLLTLRNNSGKNNARKASKLAIKDAENEFRNVSKELSELLLGQVFSTDLIDSKKRILVVKNGVFQSMPFAALPIPGNKESPNYLVSKFQVVNLPSAAILSVLRDRRQSKPEPKMEVLVLADPVFSENDERYTISQGRTSPTKKEFTKSVLRLTDYFSQDKLPRLFNTRNEAEKISSLVGSAQKRVELDFDASIGAVKRQDISDFRIVHFATHALIDDETPELSSIALSMFDEKRKPVEGFLLSDDILKLKLNAELVVLSGCRTGLGKPVRGEGLVGLTQSFFYAGASSLITSNWAVEDQATAQLMAYFYKNHLEQKHSVSESLRLAQLEMVKHPRWQSPYYWAAFSLQGDY